MAERIIELACSFCGKPQDQVRRLIAGPSVYICDECIDICNDIVTDDPRYSEDDEWHPNAIEVAERVNRLLERAQIELDVSGTLRDQGFYRVGVAAAREAVRSALGAYKCVHGGSGVEFGLLYVLNRAVDEDAELRRLRAHGLERLVIQTYFTQEADETDARDSLDVATRMVAYVRRMLGAA